MSSACAPHIKKTKKTCYTDRLLRKLAESHNQLHPDDPISTRQSSSRIHNQIMNRYRSECGSNEACWLKLEFGRKIRDDELHKYTFIPEKPAEWTRNPRTWLDTMNITNQMVLWEKKYPDFKYLGTVPVDCPSGILCELSRVNLQNLHGSGYNKAGVVFNLDYHTGSGTHWVPLYIDIDGGNIEYADSYGKIPHRLIYQFMTRMADQIESMGKTPNLIYNERQHQRGGSECGMYSQYYIIKRLEGKIPHELSSKRISDGEMLKMRNKLYRPHVEV